jgi:hypothetical protein
LQHTDGGRFEDEGCKILYVKAVLSDGKA